MVLIQRNNKPENITKRKSEVPAGNEPAWAKRLREVGTSPEEFLEDTAYANCDMDKAIEYLDSQVEERKNTPQEIKDQGAYYATFLRKLGKDQAKVPDFFKTVAQKEALKTAKPRAAKLGGERTEAGERRWMQSTNKFR